MALAWELAQRPADRVVSSPLSRARHLAEPLARHLGLTLEIEEGFRELDRGDWTFRGRDEVEAQTPGAVARYLADPEDGAAPGGERESTFTRRVWSSLDRVVASSPGASVVIVSHGHVIRAVMRRLAGWDAATSLTHFVPYHGIVEASLAPDGGGEVLSAPEGMLPPALRGAD